MARCFGRIILFTNEVDDIVGFAVSVEQQDLLVGEYFELSTSYCFDFEVVQQKVAGSEFVQPLNEGEQGVVLLVVGYHKICRNGYHLGVVVHS
jgi:hypothetical protein